jgi:hypothetical protein
LKGLLWEPWAVLVERVSLKQRSWVQQRLRAWLVLMQQKLVLMQRVPVLVKQRSQGLAG